MSISRSLTRSTGIVTLVTAAVIWPLTAAIADNSPSISDCPHGTLPLTGDAVARAADRALAAAPHLYHGIDTRGRQAVSAAIAPDAGPRGTEVAKACGTGTARRTVVVQLRFPRMLPSQSLSQGTVFVSRFTGGYRIWEVAH